MRVHPTADARRPGAARALRGVNLTLLCLAGLRHDRKNGAARHVPYPDWAGVNEDLLVQLFDSIASQADGRALVRVGKTPGPLTLSAACFIKPTRRPAASEARVAGPSQPGG